MAPHVFGGVQALAAEGDRGLDILCVQRRLRSAESLKGFFEVHDRTLPGRLSRQNCDLCILHIFIVRG